MVLAQLIVKCLHGVLGTLVQPLAVSDTKHQLVKLPLLPLTVEFVVLGSFLKHKIVTWELARLLIVLKANGALGVLALPLVEPVFRLDGAPLTLLLISEALHAAMF